MTSEGPSVTRVLCFRECHLCGGRTSLAYQDCYPDAIGVASRARCFRGARPPICIEISLRARTELQRTEPHASAAMENAPQSRAEVVDHLVQWGLVHTGHGHHSAATLLGAGQGAKKTRGSSSHHPEPLRERSAPLPEKLPSCTSQPAAEIDRENIYTDPQSIETSSKNNRALVASTVGFLVFQRVNADSCFNGFPITACHGKISSCKNWKSLGCILWKNRGLPSARQGLVMVHIFESDVCK